MSCFQVLQHLNRVNFTTPRGETFYFQGSDMTARYDLVNWQKTPNGPLKLVLVGYVDGFDLVLNESAIQWSTGLNQVGDQKALSTKYFLNIIIRDWLIV